MATNTTHIDLFAGIGGFSLAAERVGFKTQYQSEVDKACLTVLNRHYPDVQQLGDIREIETNQIQEPIKLLTGGSPCQDFSISGSRTGMAGERSGLFHQYRRMVEELRPEWIVWENVPGVLSSKGGRDFAQILQGLGQCGYRLAWSVLDAQYFGVPQRRRRVFLVGHLGDGGAAQILFDETSHPRGPKSKPTEGQSGRVAGTLAASGGGLMRMSGQRNEGDFIVLEQKRTSRFVPSEISSTLTARDHKDFGSLVATFNIQGPKLNEEISGTLRQNQRSMGAAEVLYQNTRLRRFTPLEAERLQGYPDGWTAGQSDTARYKQLGNSIAVPCVEWILQRIADYES